MCRTNRHRSIGQQFCRSCVERDILCLSVAHQLLASLCPGQRKTNLVRNSNGYERLTALTKTDIMLLDDSSCVIHHLGGHGPSSALFLNTGENLAKAGAILLSVFPKGSFLYFYRAICIEPASFRDVDVLLVPSNESIFERSQGAFQSPRGICAMIFMSFVKMAS